MKVFAWPDGHIQFGGMVPRAALELACATSVNETNRLLAHIGSTAEKFKTALFVPGTYFLTDDAAVAAAIEAYRAGIAEFMAKKKAA